MIGDQITEIDMGIEVENEGAMTTGNLEDVMIDTRRLFLNL